MKRDKMNKIFSFFVAEVLSMFTAGLLFVGPASGALVRISARAGAVVWFVGVCLVFVVFMQILGYLIYWSIVHELYNGVRYAFTHARILRGVKKALLEAGAVFVIEQYSGQEKVAKLPKTILTLEPNLSGGVIQIRNHIRYEKQLENVNLSSALMEYVVTQQYSSIDSNWYIVEFENGDIDHQKHFTEPVDFIAFERLHDSYTLGMDDNNYVPLSSLLLVGQTGSGKTYALYSLTSQMLAKPIHHILYFFDMKNSSLCVVGNCVCPERTAGTLEGIDKLLHVVGTELLEREALMKEKLGEKIDADYRHWNLPAHVIIFDEYSSFAAVLATMDKKKRDEINAILRSIVLKGRQLGFFIWIVMQKSDASDIPTAIRDNLPWKVVLGTATNTTYMTTFEHAADLPKRKFGPGQGLYTYEGRTQNPKLTSFPTLDFDILEMIKRLAR